MSRQEVPLSPEKKGQSKRMILAEEMKNIVERIVSSYEVRTQGLGLLLDTTHQILRSFQDSFLDTKQEREKLHIELREKLARYRSLRRKDFDNMMQRILQTQTEREKEVRDLLNRYLNEQKEMARDLRENLEKVKDSLANGEARRVIEFQERIKKNLSRQEERKDEVTSRLKEFKKEQTVLTSTLKEFLSKGEEFRIKNLKLALKEFQRADGEGVPRGDTVRRGVPRFPGGATNERTEAVS